MTDAQLLPALPDRQDEGRALVLPDAERDLAHRFLAARLAPATRRAYASDARLFRDWCIARGVPALPAHPETVRTYLATLAAGGTKAATINRKRAAIRLVHTTAGLMSPTTHEAVVGSF